ncbi:MAG: ATP-dependent DNA helicase RecG [Dehalococcoidia bacterium]|nr:ATP-dependent DNA helicase RecG [Dehalococcoidia bacterium]
MQGGTVASKVEAFARILRLEQRRGYDNRAVLGGLETFTARWREELAAATDTESAALVTRLEATGVFTTAYGRLAQREREGWVAKALTALDTASGSSPTAPSLTKLVGQATASLAPHVRRPAPGPSVDSPVSRVRGVGSAVAEKLNALGVESVRDLLYHFPRRHLVPARIAELQAPQEQAVIGTVWEVRPVRLGARQAQSTEAIVGDESGNIRVLWFNQPFVARNLGANDRVLVTGYLRPFRGQPTLEANGYEVLQSTEEVVRHGRLFPIYPSTEGLTQRTIRRAAREALTAWLPRLPESLPDALLARLSLLPRAQALADYHYPPGDAALLAAHRRLAFDELLLAQLAMLRRKQAWQQEGAAQVLKPPRLVVEAFLASLPFKLTVAQRRTLDEVLADLAKPVPMSRLLQGEVGSGKTVVALAAMLGAAVCGHQAALMAPTEILAEQHFLTVSRLLQGLARPAEEPYLTTIYLDPHPQPIAVGLLLGSMPKRAKEEQRKRASMGAVDILIGTHALLQGEVELPRLALAVVDEQQRFGVEQRAALRAKGERPHLLAMSATPIPRSLALTLYGDLDLSVLDQLPPGRQKVRTNWLRPDQRDDAYGFVRRQVAQRRQAFVICPLIQESETLQVRAAQEEQRRLATEVFPELRVGLLHGRMPLREKVAAMEQFRSHEMDILVSTPVVEVGVDVPNATVMLIESANRFGLAELHQFRGRVGRGEHAGYCLLLADDPSPEAQERLTLLERESDGFRVAEEDLRLRGQGEVLGTRQSGLPTMRVARLSDLALVQLARQEATRLLADDPHLAKPEHRVLGGELERALRAAPEATELS